MQHQAKQSKATWMCIKLSTGASREAPVDKCASYLNNTMKRPEECNAVQNKAEKSKTKQTAHCPHPLRTKYLWTTVLVTGISKAEQSNVNHSLFINAYNVEHSFFFPKIIAFSIHFRIAFVLSSTGAGKTRLTIEMDELFFDAILEKNTFLHVRNQPIYVHRTRAKSAPARMYKEANMKQPTSIRITNAYKQLPQNVLNDAYMNEACYTLLALGTDNNMQSMSTSMCSFFSSLLNT